MRFKFLFCDIVVENRHPLHTQGWQTVLPMQMCWEHQMDSRVCSQAIDVVEDPVQFVWRFQHAVISVVFVSYIGISSRKPPEWIIEGQPAYLGLACKLG